MQNKTPQALILAPTRELAEQITQEIRKFSKGLQQIQTLALVGGQSATAQNKSLELGAQIIVGTPGRTLEFLKNRNLNISNLKTLVLDEADRMLDEGFTEEVSEIIGLLPAKRQTVFFSATYPESIEILSRKFQKNPKIVNAFEESSQALQIEQYIYTAERPEKIDALLRILQQHPASGILIFCRTKLTVSEINELLNKSNVASKELHGDLDQIQRDQTMALFRGGSLRVLVATDVAARGIDIDDLDLVINFDLPSTVDVYQHRIGRTGRAGKSGIAVTIVNAYEEIKVLEIEAAIGKKLIRQELDLKIKPSLHKSLQQTKMKTIYISGGKKDKLRAGDVIGMLTAQPGAIAANDIGKIEVHDTFIYAAVTSLHADSALQKIMGSKIKGRKFKASYLK